jgi:hypothetical protein
VREGVSVPQRLEAGASTGTGTAGAGGMVVPCGAGVCALEAVRVRVEASSWMKSTVVMSCSVSSGGLALGCHTRPVGLRSSVTSST